MEGFPDLTGVDALFDADPDQDGVSNGEEYLAGTLPDSATSSQQRQVSLINEGGIDYLGVSFEQITADATVSHVCSVNSEGVLTNELAWSEQEAVLISTNRSLNGAFFTEFHYRSTVPVHESDAQFLRVKTTLNNE